MYVFDRVYSMEQYVFLAVACWAVCLDIAFVVRWQFDPTVLGPKLFNVNWPRLDFWGQIYEFGEMQVFRHQLKEHFLV